MCWWAGRDWGGEATFWPILPAGVRNIARTLGYRLELQWQFGSLRAASYGLLRLPRLALIYDTTFVRDGAAGDLLFFPSRRVT